MKTQKYSMTLVMIADSDTTRNPRK